MDTFGADDFMFRGDEFRSLTILFEDYLRIMETEVRIILNRNPELSSKKATFKAIRMAGGHILKEAKNLRQFITAISSSDDINFTPCHRCSFYKTDSLRTLQSRWMTPMPEEYLQWQFLVQYVAQTAYEQEIEGYDVALVKRPSQSERMQSMYIGLCLETVLEKA